MPPTPCFCSSLATATHSQAKRFRRRVVRAASAACRVGGLGGGTQGRLEHAVWTPFASCVRALCRDETSWDLRRVLFVLRVQPDVQGHAGHLAVRFSAARLLAARPLTLSAVGVACSSHAGRYGRVSGRYRSFWLDAIQFGIAPRKAAVFCGINSRVGRRVSRAVAIRRSAVRPGIPVLRALPECRHGLRDLSLEDSQSTGSRSLSSRTRQPARLDHGCAGRLLPSAISAGAIAGIRRFPYVFVGWCWDPGTLIPTIGLVQIGLQRMADRYTYFPLIGIFLAIVWFFPT